MSSLGSVTNWMQQLKVSDQVAMQRLWERYYPRVVALARKRLQGTTRAAADEEDVALSAFNSFFAAATDGRFPRLADRDDLWNVLVVITIRKAGHLSRRDRAQIRGEGKVVSASALAGDEQLFADAIGAEPDPEFAAQVAEEYRRLLALLAPNLRSIAVWKMEGYTNEDIAAKLDCALVTVERKLAVIRKRWSEET